MKQGIINRSCRVVVSEGNETAVEIRIVRFWKIERGIESRIASFGGHLRWTVGVLDSRSRVGISGEKRGFAEVGAVEKGGLAGVERVSHGRGSCSRGVRKISTEPGQRLHAVDGGGGGGGGECVRENSSLKTLIAAAECEGARNARC